MSDFKEEEKLKIAPSEQGLDANIENWLETLTTVAKSKFGNYASVIRTKEVPKEWTEELIPTAEEEERAWLVNQAIGKGNRNQSLGEGETKGQTPPLKLASWALGFGLGLFDAVGPPAPARGG